MFLNNTRLFAELEGSMDVQRKEQKCLVKEFAVGVILECKTHEIRDVPEKFISIPDETTGRGFRTEALLTCSSKRNRDVVVVWTLGCQETKKLHASGITFIVVFNNKTNDVSNLDCDCETRQGFMALHVMSVSSSTTVVCMVLLSRSTGKCQLQSP